jgi:hypothetical protein
MKNVFLVFLYLGIYASCIAADIPDIPLDTIELIKKDGTPVNVSLYIKDNIRIVDTIPGKDRKSYVINISPNLYNTISTNHPTLTVEQYKTITSSLKELHDKTQFESESAKINDYNNIKRLCWEFMVNSVSAKEGYALIAKNKAMIFFDVESNDGVLSDKKNLKQKMLDMNAYIIQSSLQDAKGLISHMEKVCFYEKHFESSKKLCTRLIHAIEQFNKTYPEHAKKDQ